jgi:hypothetical protein
MCTLTAGAEDSGLATMDALSDIIYQIHSTPIRAVLYITGGAVQVPGHVSLSVLCHPNQ